jgi:16S rRNA (guanine527-N7)-methyltransferase
MIPSQAEFIAEIQSRGFGLSAAQLEKIGLFGHILHRENESQNLTRILGVSEFVDGHLIDALELLKLKTLGKRVLDIGSGSGVPGLLAACVDFESDRIWFLVESEKQKAEYLSRAIAELGLRRVSALPKRVEEVIQVLAPDTVIARAVGTVEKIGAWIWNCSTWNNLILFKSKGWDLEWKNARLSKVGKKLTIIQALDYSFKDRTRYLISLSKNKFG